MMKEDAIMLIYSGCVSIYSELSLPNEQAFRLFRVRAPMMEPSVSMIYSETFQSALSSIACDLFPTRGHLGQAATAASTCPRNTVMNMMTVSRPPMVDFDSSENGYEYPKARCRKPRSSIAVRQQEGDNEEYD